MTEWPPSHPGDAADIQGIVVSGYSAKPISRALLVDFGTAREDELRAWLESVNSRVTCANAKEATALVETALLQVALSADGVRRLRPDVFGQSLDGFDICFAEGMTERMRWVALGDSLPDAIVGGKLHWRGTKPVPDSQPRNSRAATAHAVLLLYAASDLALDALDKTLAPPQGARVVRRIETSLEPRQFGTRGAPDGSRNTFREHFGFADSISQPLPDPKGEGPCNQVAAGDLLLGKPNAYEETVFGPLIPSGVRGACHLRELPAKAKGFRGFGINGTYLVVRELHQDVAGFWSAMRREAARLVKQTTNGRPPIDDLWVAERVVGRSREGHSLRRGAPLKARANGEPENNFGYARPEEVNFTCPVGSHVRRANPRDGLLQPGGTAADRADLIRSVNNHRILRRGRSFGTPLPYPAEQDGGERGLLFLAINADITRQFELIMRTWLLNPAFAALDNEIDPIAGSATQFSIQQSGARLRANVERYVRLAGGDYYFLPSRSALEFLAS